MTWRGTELLTGGVTLTALGFLWMRLADTPDAARMYPRFIIAVMGVLTCVMIARSLAGRTAPSGGVEDWRFFKNASRFTTSVCLFVIYLTGVGTVGYFTSSAVFLLALPVALGFRDPVMLGLTMAGFLAFVFGIFVGVFDRRLPPEIIGGLLGG
jgi:hypothetical protein